MLDMVAPGTILLLKSFLGAAGYLSKYISDYAELVLPLREMDGGRPKYADILSEWTARRLRALESLKAALNTTPVLQRFSGPQATRYSKFPVILTYLKIDRSNLDATG